MSYDEDEEVLGGSDFNPSNDDADLDDDMLFDEPLDGPSEDFKFEEEDQEEETM